MGGERVFLGLVFMPYTAFAEVAGLCANCHTMHASQTPWPTGWGSGGPNPALLVNDCVGCHSSATSSTHYNLGGCMVPVVLYTGGAAPSSYLAGGNFYWVKQGDDTKGHNVFLNENDEDLSAGAPGDPGFASCGTNPCHLNLSQPADIGMSELDGKYGCEGCHLNIRHHAGDHANGEPGLVGCYEKRQLTCCLSINHQGQETTEHLLPLFFLLSPFCFPYLPRTKRPLLF